MNTRQAETLEWLRKEILRHDGLQDVTDNYEYKFWEISYGDHVDRRGHRLVFLVSEVGRKNDEGTMAEIYARRHRHICIGAKGGVTLLNAKRRDQAKGHWVTYALTK